MDAITNCVVLQELDMGLKSSDGLDFDDTIVPLRHEMLAFAQRILRNRASAEDAVQSALLRAFRAWPAFTGYDQPSMYARAWMFKIVSNQSFNIKKDWKKFIPVAITQASHEPRVGENVVITDASDNSDNFTKNGAFESNVERFGAPGFGISRVDLDRLEVTTSRLKPHHRVVLELTVLHDMTQQEIADHLGIPRGTVSSRLTRAYTHMREIAARMGIATKPLGRARVVASNQPLEVVQPDADSVDRVVGHDDALALQRA